MSQGSTASPYLRPIVILAIFMAITILILHGLGYMETSWLEGMYLEEPAHGPAFLSLHYGLWLLFVPLLWAVIGVVKVQSPTARFSFLAWVILWVVLEMALAVAAFTVFARGFGGHMLSD